MAPPFACYTHVHTVGIPFFRAFSMKGRKVKFVVAHFRMTAVKTLKIETPVMLN